MDSLVSPILNSFLENVREKSSSIVKADEIGDMSSLMSLSIQNTEADNNYIENDKKIDASDDGKENKDEEKKQSSSDTLSGIKLTVCKKVLSVLTNKLKTIENKIDKLLIKDLKNALTHVKNAKTALFVNNIDLFKEYIGKSSTYATEAINTVDESSHKMIAYCIRIFTEFLIFSKYFLEPLSGLVQIHSILDTMTSDKKLINNMKKIFKSKVYWTGKEKVTIKICILFAAKINLIVHNICNNYTNNVFRQSNVSAVVSDDIDTDEKKESVASTPKVDMRILRNYASMMNGASNSNTNSNVLDKNTQVLTESIDKWSPNIANGSFFGMNVSIIDRKKLDSIIIDIFGMFPKTNIDNQQFNKIDFKKTEYASKYEYLVCKYFDVNDSLFDWDPCLDIFSNLSIINPLIIHFIINHPLLVTYTNFRNTKEQYNKNSLRPSIALKLSKEIGLEKVFRYNLLSAYIAVAQILLKNKSACSGQK